MDAFEMPSLAEAISGDELVLELEQGCPFQIDLADIYRLSDAEVQFDLPDQTMEALREVSVSYDMWKLPVDLPPARRESRRPKCPVNLVPLYEFYTMHEDALGGIRWTYDFYYLEVLAKERRAAPVFWATPQAFRELKRAWDLMSQTEDEGARQKREQLIAALWSDAVEDGTVMEVGPTDWLELAQLGESIASDHFFVPETIHLSHVPVYVGVSAEDIRQCMIEDMKRTLIFVPEGPEEAAERWESFAFRLGIRARWPSREAFLVERRDTYVLNRLKEGRTVREVARCLMDQRLYRVRKRNALSADFENVRRTVHCIKNRLIKEGRLREQDASTASGSGA